MRKLSICLIGIVTTAILGSLAYAVTIELR